MDNPLADRQLADRQLADSPQADKRRRRSSLNSLTTEEREAQVAEFEAATPEPYPAAILEPDPQDWAQWCQHPITRYVATAMVAASHMQESAFKDQAWVQPTNEEDRVRAVTTAEVFRQFINANLRDYRVFTRSKGR